MTGIDPSSLSHDHLLQELGSLYHTRLETLRHGSNQALDEHTARTAELEQEYRRRFPDREIDPHRLRPVP